MTKKKKNISDSAYDAELKKSKNDIIKIFNNIRCLRVFCRAYPLSMLEEMCDKFTSVVKEKHDEEMKKQEKAEEHKKKIEQCKQMLHNAGIDLSELYESLQNLPQGDKNPHHITRRPKRPEKYCYIDNGERKSWTGQGRRPKPIENSINAGEKVLEDFLCDNIKNSEEWKALENSSFEE